jgi:CMP-N-acetylneuraminic acid synthetase
MKNILAVIPARGNSKSIKNKNIKLLFGKPLIYYSINIAKRSKLINRIIVSSDSKKVINIAKKYGAEAPFVRPKELSKDNSKDHGLFLHCLEWLEKNENYIPDLIVHLRPTYPIRSAKIVDKAIQFALRNRKYDCIRSVCEPFQNPYKMWHLNTNNFLTPLLGNFKNELYNSPRQKLRKVYWQNAYLDIVKYDTIKKQKSMTGKKIIPFILPSNSIFDIDDKFSFKMVEEIFKKNYK